MDAQPTTYRLGTDMSIISLLSPPEIKKHDSFSSSFDPSNMTASPATGPSKKYSTNTSSLLLPRVYASPPISPTTSVHEQNVHNVDQEGGSIVKDPPLFGPGYYQEALSPDVPLFETDYSLDEVDKEIKMHIASTNAEFNSTVERPSYHDYVLAITLKSVATEQAMKNPRAWLKQEREYLERYRAPSKVTKSKPLKALAPKPQTSSRKIAGSAPRVVKPSAKRTPSKRPSHSFDVDSTLPTPKTTPKQRNANGTKSKTEDDKEIDFTAIKDCCPPIDVLNSAERNPFRGVEYKSSSTRDLTNDPHQHLLHEYERHLASLLRLSCGRYLSAKRRIFQHRVQCLRDGKKEFRKTDAQARCGIDVNKASKLWIAFDKVDWFNESHFRQYL